jgi:flavin-dependent dehydrogenase
MGERFDSDVFIAGGGPAGLAAAIAARQTGLTVIVADSARPPIDKACGEGIVPEGVAALRQLGVTLPLQPADRLRTASFSPGQFSALAGMRFIDSNGAITARFPRGSGCGVRRTVLHQMLVERAEEVGVELRWGSHVSLPPNWRNDGTGRGAWGVVVDGGAVRCRWLIAADGQNSSLRAQAGLDGWRGARRRFGFRYHYGVAPWSEFVEVHWGERSQLYVTPVGGDEICVALLTAEPHLSSAPTRAATARAGDRIFDEALAHFPAVAERLGGARRLSRLRGGLTVTRTLPLVWRENLALIGEASGSVDAISGEGLTMAFQQALALAAALQAGDLRLYQAAHRRISRLPHFMTWLMLNMDRHGGFRRRVLRAFSTEPGLFAHLLAIHVGAMSPWCFGVRGTVSLGWHLLTA